MLKETAVKEKKNSASFFITISQGALPFKIGFLINLDKYKLSRLKLKKIESIIKYQL